MTPTVTTPAATDRRKYPRPGLKARPWMFRHGDVTLPGIALMHRTHGLVGHFTPAEARALADRLHDLADHLESGEAHATTTA